VSSIGEEKQFNARTAGKSVEEFVEIMNNLGLPVPKRIHEAVPANLSGGLGRSVAVGVEEHLLSSEASTVRNVSPLQLAEAAAAASVHILDVRTPMEFAARRVPGSFNIPLDRLDPELLKTSVGVDTEIYVICQTGTRSQLVAEMLRTSGFRRVVHVDGGTNAWSGAGLAVERSKHTGVSLERQVRIVAGLIVFLGVLTGALVHPFGYWVAGAIGAGLVITGFANLCGPVSAACENAVESQRGRCGGRAGVGGTGKAQRRSRSVLPHDLLHPNREHALQVVTRIGAKRNQRLGRLDAVDLVHARGDDVGKRLVRAHAHHRHQIEASRDRVDLGNAFDGRQLFGHLDDARTRHVQKHDSSNHGRCILHALSGRNTVPPA
jgi:rhodanese-related sulfurtransferase